MKYFRVTFEFGKFWNLRDSTRSSLIRHIINWIFREGLHIVGLYLCNGYIILSGRVILAVGHKDIDEKLKNIVKTRNSDHMFHGAESARILTSTVTA